MGEHHLAVLTKLFFLRMYVVITKLQNMKFEFIGTHRCCYLYVCLHLVAVHLEKGDAKIIADEGLQIKTYAKYSWPLNSKCYAYFTGHQVFNLTSYNQWYSHLLPSFWQCNWHYLFQRLRLVATEIWRIRSYCRYHRCSSHCSFYMHDCTIDFSSPYCFQKHDLLYF